MPIDDIPMIINTLNIYKDKEVIIIADHLSDVLENYLKTFYKRDNYRLVRTTESGTAGGLTASLSFIPDDEPFILTWADLFFEDEPKFFFDRNLLVGLSNTFKCRWSLDGSKFVNESSTTQGVAGFFVFKDKSRFKNLTLDKSLVRGFLSDEYKAGEIGSFYLSGCFEVGEKEKYEEIIANKITHRFFNKVEMDDTTVYKSCIVPEYANVHQNEKDWYEFVDGKFDRTPKLYSINPLIMQRINGKHAWDIDQDKSTIINNYCDTLDALHSLGTSKGSIGECMNVYFTKAWNRVDEVAPILRYLNEPVITINGVSVSYTHLTLPTNREV